MSAYELPELFFEDRQTAIDVLLAAGTISRGPGNDLVTTVYGYVFYFDSDYFIDLLWSMRSEQELIRKYMILAKLDFNFVDLFY